MTQPRELTSRLNKSDFFQKLLLLFLLITDTSFCVYYFLKIQPVLSIVLQHLFSDLVIGLLSGFSVRALFTRRNRIIKYILGSSAMILGLVFIGWLSAWEIGFGPLIFWRNSIDWRGLINLILGLISMLLALNAWYTKQAYLVPVNDLPNPIHTPIQASIQSGVQSSTIAEPGPDITNPPRVLPREISKGRKVKPKSIPVKTDAKTGKKTRISPSSIIHLAKEEEHLCPYCLEPVLPRDTRGIVECQVCHTLHHGDCWEITGACQVPHYTA